MATGTLTVRVRPVRIAFLVQAQDRAGLQRAIEISTFLWGGAYNPIVPVFSRTPRRWEPHPVRLSPSPSEILMGYLEGFDPDIVVPVGKCARHPPDVGHRDLVTAEEMMSSVSQRWVPKVGIGLVEVLRTLINEEFKYQRNDKLQLVLPEFAQSHRLFLSAVFGAIPAESAGAMNAHLTDALPVDKPTISIASYASFLAAHFLFPRRIGMTALEKKPSHSPTVFVLDAKNVLDLIDYWNLRAAGHYVIPVPIQAAKVDAVRDFVRMFIDLNYRPYRDNPNMYHDTTVQRARSLSEEAVKAICDSLNVERPTNTTRPKYSLRWWYPRLWDRWARDNAWGEDISFPYSHEVEHRISEGEHRLDLRSSDPHIELFHEYSGKPRFANEFHFHFFSSKEPMAEVIPEGSRELTSAIGRFGYDDWRFSRGGLVFLAKNTNDLIFIDIPRAEPVVTEWLRERGWKVQLSAPGRMALQLFRQLGGAWGISWLAYRGVIRLLSDLEKEAGKSWPAVIGELQKIIDSEGLFFKKERFLEGLLETNALLLGAAVQCPVCTRRNWYEMDKLRYQLQCKFCLSEFGPPLDSPKRIGWTYRAHGPFAGSAAQGAFSVLLTLRFLADRDHARITPLFSYTAAKDQHKLESDLTCLYRTNMRGDGRLHVVHAECKSHSCFEKRDFDRMKQLGEEFPGSTLVFATFLDMLDSYSARELKAMATKQRRNRLARKAYNPIIVLTSTELFSRRGAPECWKNLPIYEEADRARFSEPRLDVLADVTQRLYLSMEAWYEWSEREWAKRRNRSKEPT